MKSFNRFQNVWFALGIALVLSFLLYANSLSGDFVADDKLVILQNPLLKGELSGFSQIFSTPYYYGQPHAGLYRPLTVASYNFNRLFASGPIGFHWFNIMLNALNGFLVWLIIFRLLNQKAAYGAMILFLFLPIHSEAVSSIVGRAELLAFLFGVWAWLLVQQKKYLWASIVFFLGLLSKETAVGFFLFFLYWWRWPERRTFKQVFFRSLYFLPSLAGYALLRFWVLGQYAVSVDHLMAYNPLKFAPFWPALWTSFKVFYLYLLKTFIPHSLSSDYSFDQIPVVANPFLSYEALTGMAILTAIFYLAIKKRNSLYGWSAALFLAAYFLISNWTIKIGTIMGERLMYAPSLGLAILAASAVKSLELKLKNYNLKLKIFNPKLSLLTLYFILLTLLVWYGYIIFNRNQDWQNETALLSSGYAASPRSVVSLTNMAFLAFSEQKYVEAIRWINQARAILPDHLPAVFLAGHAYKNTGDLKLAETSWLKVAELNSNYPAVYLSLGLLYYEQERWEEAEAIFQRGFQLEKTWSKAFPLALVKINRGRYQEAIQLIVEYFGVDPQKRELRFALGLAYLKQGDKTKAEFYLSQFREPNEKIEDYFKKVINQKVFKITEY